MKLLVLTVCAGLSILVLAAGFASGGEDSPILPGAVVLDSLEDMYEPVQFDHQMHTYVADSCGVCHHTHMTKSEMDCGGCHDISAHQFKEAVSSSFLSCEMCHSDLDPENPGMPSLKVAYHKQCLGCHMDMGSVGESPEGCTQQCHARKE